MRIPISPRPHAELPRALEIGTAAVFATLSWLRGARIFHPAGDVYAGSVTIDPPDEPMDAPLLDEPGTYPAIVRVSRGVGLPARVPDILGLSMKIPDRYGPGRDQDVLMVSSGATPWERRMLIPSTDHLGRPYSSILPYEIAGRRYLFGAIPERLAAPTTVTRERLRRLVTRTDVRFGLAIAGAIGPWRPVGTLRLAALIGPDDDVTVTYDPWNTAASVRPAGILNAIREPAYAGARDGRGAQERSVTVATSAVAEPIGFGVERVRITAR